MNSTTLASGSTRRGLGLIMLSAVLWGTVGVSTRGLYEISATNPLSIGFFRMGIAAPVLLVACWWILGRRTLSMAWRDFGLMVVIGAMLALYQACFFAAIARVGVAIATLITLCTAPVIVALLSALLTGERPTGRVALALTAALFGTSLLTNIGLGTTDSTDLWGVLLALGSATGYAILAIAGRALSRCHPLQVTAVAFSSGVLLLLPLAASFGTGLVLSYPLQGWALLLYLGLVPSALAYGIFLVGMRTTSATIASIVTLLEPLTATLLAWLIFGEQLRPLGLLGAALLLGAIALLYQHDTPNRIQPASEMSS